ncbi:MAG: hypothetical protein ACREPY_16260 [Rhodanobacteraceae bacterium]
MSESHPEIRIKDPLPRFRTLAVCIKGALLGLGHPHVQHMVRRNRYLEMLDALNAAKRAARTGR